MRHFFILGTNPELSLAECFALFENRRHQVVVATSTVLIVDFSEPFDPVAFMRKAGGTIKTGTINEALTAGGMKEFVDGVVSDLENRQQEVPRRTFGISEYPLGTGKMFHAWKVGLEIKKRLKEAGLGARFVRPQTGDTLTSVVVEKNKLVTEGGEYVVFSGSDATFIGTTDAVQPFEEFSESDYGRPGRDTIQGMLPPKLARMMVNIAGAKDNGAVLDPFCGSGTVLTEAARLGFMRLHGSDLNPKAIEYTEQNIAWLRERKLLPADAVFSLHVADARDVARHLRPKSIDAVVTEPLLGPPLRGHEKRGDLQRRLFELGKLYYQALSAWKPLLTPDAAVVFALPLYVMEEERHGILGKEFEKLGYVFEPLLPEALEKKFSDRITKHRGAVYGRPGQHVYREVVRLRPTAKSSQLELSPQVGSPK